MTEQQKTDVKFTPDEVIARQRNRQLMIMTAIIVVLSGLVWLASRSSAGESPIQDIRLVGGTLEEPAFKSPDVHRIQVWKGAANKPFELSRDGANWRVPARFNALAAQTDVDSLLTRIIDARRISRASTTTVSQYINYGLNDEDAVHVKLIGDKGNELVHFMIGRSETGTRDFVRLIGEGAPEGIFELSGLGGSLDTLYSALNLDSQGNTQASSWVDTGAFRPLPENAIAQRVTLRDGVNSVTFTRKTGSDPEADEWELTSPRKADADGAQVRTILNALQNYYATDVAGRDTDAVSLEVAAAEKEISVEYSLESDVTTSRLYFGKRDGKGSVAVWFKTQNQGELIWWAADYVLARIFRPTPEYMRKVRVTLIPDGVDASDLTVDDNGAMLKVVRDGTNWKLTAPTDGEAERLEVVNLLTGLNTLQGYPVGDTTDKTALGLGAGVSTRSITVNYPDKKPPEGEAPMKTAVLYFGNTQQGELPVMRSQDGVDVVYWVREDHAVRLFQPAANYIKLADVSVVGREAINQVRLQDGDAILLLNKTAPEGEPPIWRIVEPWDEAADQAQTDALIGAIAGLRGGKLATPLDKAQYKLGPDLSTRRLDLRTGEGDGVKNTQMLIGEMKDGLHTALVVKPDGTEEFWLLRYADLYRLFVGPADYRVLPTFSGKVRHILISWKGRGPVVPKDLQRTRDQAWKLANELMERANKGEDFVELQKQHNEDDDVDPTGVLDVGPTEGWVKPFLRLSSQLEVGKAGVVESEYGFHVIKRIE